MTDIFFADTYALIEILRGNPEYRPFLFSFILTSKLNLMELYYHFLHDQRAEEGERALKLYSRFLIPVSIPGIRDGMAFKLLHRKEKLSYADCIGYALAQQLGVKFLTGDKKFREKENVEFVK